MKKIINAFLIIACSVFCLCGCIKKKELTIWVGPESVDFYTAKMAEYVENYNSTHDKKFPNYVIKAADSGSAAAAYLQDTEAGPDIFTIAHDNLGKLTEGSSTIMPITDQSLLDQIANDNSEAFQTAVKSTVQGTEYVFGSPYIAQALVYYYNSSMITEEQAKTWEGCIEGATAHNAKATSLLGTDGYNNSFLLLARKVNSDGSTSTSVQIYEDGIQQNCFCSGDDTIAVMKWGQDFFGNVNGGARCDTSSSGWEVELANGTSAGLIGGAWNYNAAKAALGSNFAVTVLPTFTINESQATEGCPAGTVFQSGTFADCKIFVMKKGSEFQEYLQDVVKFLSSKEVQEESFVACANLPAYKNATQEFPALNETNATTIDQKRDIALANAQLGMFEYGIAQPFGVKTKYNSYYYSKSAPDYLKALLNDKWDAAHVDGYTLKFDTDAKIKAELEEICNIWKTSKRSDASE